VADRSQICAACDRYVSAVDVADVEAILALYAEDAVVEDPVGSEPKVGKEALRAFYEGSLGPAISTRRIGPITAVADHAAFQFRVDVDLGDTKIKLTTTDVMKFDAAGRIIEMVAYPDGEADPDAAP
jgi:steroid Delta-isomerase